MTFSGRRSATSVLHGDIPQRSLGLGHAPLAQCVRPDDINRLGLAGQPPSSDVLIATRDPSAQMAPTTRPSLLTRQVLGLSAGACAARGRVSAQRRQRLAEPSPP